MRGHGRPFTESVMLARLERAAATRRKLPRERVGAKDGRKNRQPFTPSELLFEIQLQARGFIEVDLAMRTTDPFKYERHIIGEPTIIRGLEPGEIMKLRRDIQAFLLQWRTRLALERRDEAIEQRMVIESEAV